MHTEFWTECLKRRDHLDDLGRHEDESERNRVRGYGLDSFGFEQEQVANSCKHANDPSGFSKGNTFLH
jgi:hypothetical protein